MNTCWPESLSEWRARQFQDLRQRVQLEDHSSQAPLTPFSEKDRDFSLSSIINQMRDGNCWGQKLIEATFILNNGKSAVQLCKDQPERVPRHGKHIHEFVLLRAGWRRCSFRFTLEGSLLLSAADFLEKLSVNSMLYQILESERWHEQNIPRNGSAHLRKLGVGSSRFSNLKNEHFQTKPPTQDRPCNLNSVIASIIGLTCLSNWSSLG